MDNSMPALERALATLNCLAAHPAGRTISEVGETTDIPRATLYRILRVLKSEEYVTTDARGAFVLGPAFARMAALAPSEPTMIERLQPVMGGLAEQAGETVKLVVREGLEALTVAVTQSSNDSRVAAKVGARLPLYVGASQRLLLAAAPADVIEAVLTGPLERRTPSTIVDAARLRRDLEVLRKRGWASGRDEGVQGIGAAASAVLGRDGTVVAALVSVYIHAGKTPAQLRQIQDATVAAAEQATQALK